MKSKWPVLNDRDVAFALASSIGRLWRVHRRQLKPKIVAAVATLLHTLHDELQPEVLSSPIDCIGTARRDVHSLLGLLASLASPNDVVHAVVPVSTPTNASVSSVIPVPSVPLPIVAVSA